MNLQDYQTAVNKTWKKDDGLKELRHCRLAVIEEVGEIAGWYKKHLAYGVDKEEIKPQLKGELGDLLYYLVKLSELSECNAVISAKFNPMEIPTIEYVDITGVLGVLSECALAFVQQSPHSERWIEAMGDMMDTLLLLIISEGWELEDIQFSNLAKLERRHGQGFKEDQSLPENRDVKGEDEALK